MMDVDILIDPTTSQHSFDPYNQGQALAFQKSGDHPSAILLFRQAIDAMLSAGANASLLAAARSALGESLLGVGELDAAEGELTLALAIQMQLRPIETHLLDATVTRENLAQLYQAKDLPELAKQTSADGVLYGQVCCSHHQCPKRLILRGQFVGLCGGCRVCHNCALYLE